MPTDVRKLLLRLCILLAPFAILFAAYLTTAPSPETELHLLLEDKIARLILATSTPPVIAGGDSRAQFAFVPSVFHETAGYAATNISVGFGTVHEFADALARHGLLGEGHLLILSVSSYQINDAYFNFKQIDRRAILNETDPVTRIRDLSHFEAGLADFYLAGFKTALRPSVRIAQERMDATTLAQGGYVASEGFLSPDAIESPSSSPWYATVRTGGVKQADFEAGLKELGTSGDPVVIYIGPEAPPWHAAVDRSNAQTVEDNFRAVITATIAPYPNLYFIDFSATNTLPLSDFSDDVHVNRDGAIAFTRLLVATLKERGILRSWNSLEKSHL